MDAISFVLGVRTAQLRGGTLKELIYRGESDEKEARSASVEMIYEHAGEDGKPSWTQSFKRIIRAAGSSGYEIDGRSVLWDEYNQELKQIGVLVKARNFLVFQVVYSAVAVCLHNSKSVVSCGVVL
jgi:structural maintenance of chromosome 1